MSIETALAENTAAILKLVAATDSLLALRTDAIEKVTTAVNAASGKGAKATEAKKDDAKKDEPKGDDAGKGQISTNPEDRKNPYEGIKELIAEYVTEIDRPEEREARKQKMRDLLNHEKIKKADVEKATSADHIREDAIELFKKNVAGLKAKGAITQPAEVKKDDDDILG